MKISMATFVAVSSKDRINCGNVLLLTELCPKKSAEKYSGPIFNHIFDGKDLAA